MTDFREKLVPVKRTMRRMALRIMKRDTHSRRSIEGRRSICSYLDTYLEQLLFNSESSISQVRSLHFARIDL